MPVKTSRVLSRCSCGAVKSKWVAACRHCAETHQAARFAEAQSVVASGRCPRCGRELRFNNAMAGWWQCGAFGAPGFRSPQYRTDAIGCDFQTFTE